MMVYCQQCRAAYDVGFNLDHPHRLLHHKEWEEGYPCITDLCRGRLIKAKDQLREETITKAKYVISLTEEEFYAAVQGATLQPVTLQRVTQCLSGKKISQVLGEELKTTPARVIVREMILGDGTRLHFASSTHGACLYKIEEPINGQDSTSRASDISSKD